MINALLVRWHGGWHEVTAAGSIAAHGRREALLGLGAVQSVAELERVADIQLAFFGRPRVDITADLRPHGTEAPYLAFNVGDTVELPGMAGGTARERVRAVTVAEDADGALTYAADLADVLLTQQERFEETLKKMADGTVRGSSTVATPVAQIAFKTGKDCCPPAATVVETCE